MELGVNLLMSFLFLYSIYQLGSLAGLFSESSGVANIAIEGNMIIGATLFAISYQMMPESISSMPQLNLFISIMISIILSSVYMLLLALFTNRYLADHVIVGTGMNLLAPALALILALSTIANRETIEMGSAFVHWTTNVNGYIPFNKLCLWMLGVTLMITIASWFYLNKTQGGLRLKSSGENPYSLETAGISVAKTRTKSIFISGLLSGLAGAIFIINTPTFNFTVLGSGFISIAILIMSGYKVMGTMVYSIIFSILMAVFTNWLYIDPTSTNSDVMLAIPFLIPIIGLLVFRNHNSPAAVGKNFKKDQR